MKRVVISHVFGFANKGDWELLKSLINQIKLSFEEDVEIVGICKNPHEQSLYVNNVAWIKQLGSSERRGYIRSLEILLGYSRIVLLLPVIRSLFPTKFSRLVSGADFVVACPGGYLHDANRSLYTNYVNLLAVLLLNRKVILAPQSIGPVGGRINRRIMKFLLVRCSTICTRESYSKDFCLSLGIDASKIVPLLDMAFYPLHDDSDKGSLSLPDRYIASTAIKWLYPNSHSPQLMYDAYLRELVESYEKLADRFDCSIVVLKQIEKYGKDSGDEVIFEDMRSMCASNRIIFVDDFVEVSRMKLIIGQSIAFLGSRMHSNIFALSQGVPTVAISYQPKTKFIMIQLGLEKFSLEIDEFSADDILDTISMALDKKEAFASARDNLLKEARRDAKLFRKILIHD